MESQESESSGRISESVSRRLTQLGSEVCIAALLCDCVISYSVTRPAVIYPFDGPNERDAAQCWRARLITNDRAPTKIRLKAHVVSKLNQLRDTNLRPR